MFRNVINLSQPDGCKTGLVVEGLEPVTINPALKMTQSLPVPDWAKFCHFGKKIKSLRLYLEGSLA